MTDIQWAAEDTSTRTVLGPALKRALGLGLLAGSGEFVAVCATTPLDLSFDQALVLGIASMAASIIMAAILTAVLVWPAARLGSGASHRLHGRVLGLVGGGLVAWYLWPAGATLLDSPGRLPSALAFFAMPIGVAGVVSLNARYWIQRADQRLEADGVPGPAWSTVSFALAMVLTLVSAFTVSGRTFGNAAALQTDPPVLLITVDALRHDRVSAVGEGDLRTAAIDELAKGGTVFTNAVTPMPMTVPAHAALFTGLHPIRTGVLSDHHQLPARFKTLGERLSDEGYATAAFVSNRALGRGSGLEQGFAVYDDDIGPGLRGLAELSFFDAILELWGVNASADVLAGLSERSGEETLGLAMAWVRDHGQGPFMLWVHLGEPRRPYQSHGASGGQGGDKISLYDEEVMEVDRLIGDFLDALTERVDRPMLVVFAGAYGQNLGDDGLGFGAAGLFDQVVRVPLIVRPPRGSPLHSTVGAQVRTMDVSNTVLALLGLDQADDTESGNLTAFMEGTQTRDYASFLYGQTMDSVERGSVFGYRASKSGGQPGDMLKFVWNPGLEKHWLFDLSTDPHEAADMSLSQASVVEQFQAQIRKELASAAPEGDLATGLRARVIGSMQR